MLRTYLGGDFDDFFHDLFEGGRFFSLSMVVEGDFFTELPRIRHDCYNTKHCTMRGTALAGIPS